MPDTTPQSPRCSGILCHPSSLPSKYGIGDIGKSSLDFLEWLHKAGQRLWQFLPLNPADDGGSPYSTPSAMAGNPMLIAVEPLVEMGLLQSSDIKELAKLPSTRVDFSRLAPLKRKILRTAYENFKSSATNANANPNLEEWHKKYQDFSATEGPTWLNDYAIFTALHDKYKKCWADWPAELRDRDGAAIEAASTELADAIDQHRFVQFIFTHQWNLVHDRAKELNIRLVGDIPIFVAYDSADVWANRGLFKLDPTTGKQTVMAGVPPDYFSATGQLWGNPLYNWTACAAENYAWWTLRFRRTLAVCDVIRLDHFRGFQAAWEVPAGSKTAEHGTWVEGPGTHLFHALEKNLGSTSVPIIAEDLGLITPQVIALREALNYPGMKVLQFAWNAGENGSYGAHSDHLPHNIQTHRSVLYTGTHDSDTVRGWAEKASASERRAVRRYMNRTAPSSDPGAPTPKRKRLTRTSSKSAETPTNGKAEEEDEALDVIPTCAWDFITLAMASVSDMAIVQLQDALELGSDARMNLPGT
ncbi:hypothetical protein HK104_006544, partial [Borealophlyctis nickersoniae]